MFIIPRLIWMIGIAISPSIAFRFNINKNDILQWTGSVHNKWVEQQSILFIKATKTNAIKIKLKF